MKATSNSENEFEILASNLPFISTTLFVKSFSEKTKNHKLFNGPARRFCQKYVNVIVIVKANRNLLCF